MSSYSILTRVWATPVPLSELIRRVFLGVAPNLPTANRHTGQDATRRCTDNLVDSLERRSGGTSNAITLSMKG